jgi:hypothetical protein
MEFLKKIQSLPKTKKLIIFWSVFVLFCILMFSIWLKRTTNLVEQWKNKNIFQEAERPFLETKKELPLEDLNQSTQELEQIKTLIDQLNRLKENNLSPEELEQLKTLTE